MALLPQFSPRLWARIAYPGPERCCALGGRGARYRRALDDGLDRGRVVAVDDSASADRSGPCWRSFIGLVGAAGVETICPHMDLGERPSGVRSQCGCRVGAVAGGVHVTDREQAVGHGVH